MISTCPATLILDLITLLTFAKDIIYEDLNRVMFSVLLLLSVSYVQNILLSALFSNSLNLRSPLAVRTLQKTDKIVMFYILIF